MWATSNNACGFLYRYTGSLPVGAALLPDKPLIRKESRPPMFFPN